MINRENIQILRHCPLFVGIDEDDVINIASCFKFAYIPSGATIIENEAVQSMIHIIVEGHALVYNQDVHLATLSSGTVIGESALTFGKATASVIAKDEMQILSIDREDLLGLLKPYPRLISNIVGITQAKLKASNDNALKESREREEKLKKQVKERTRELKKTLDDLTSANEDLKNLNNQLAETRDNLIRTQQFRQQFLANMSHEIRTPMNAIVGLTNLLLKSPLNELQHKYLNVISKSGDNLLVIINDILDLSKIQAGKMELEKVSFSLKETLQNVHTILSLKADEKGLYFDLKIADQVPDYIIGDETRLTQILVNLTGNAIKFTERGRVAINSRIINEEKDDMLIEFEVRDTGIGIPPDKLDKIFESFSQASSDTTRKFGGTGLGLTISRQLIELNGGRIRVESVPGEGSSFIFTIPTKKGNPPAQDQDLEKLHDIDMSGVKILIAEDNEFNQMVAVDTIKDIFPEITIDVAENGTEAFEKNLKNDYDLIFMDAHMPEMNGYEATQKIRELSGPKAKVTICAMTASVTREEIDACFDSGMDDYLAKPFSLKELKLKLIRNLHNT